MRRAFTLVELLVVIVIILIASVLTLSTVLPAMSHRQVSEAASLLQGQIAGARDAAIRDNSISGMRLLLDPNTPNAVNRIIPLSQPPSYAEGVISTFPGQIYPAAVLLGTQALVIEEQVSAVVSGVTVPNSPTSWFWNVRVGDRIQINGAGPWLTVCGPAAIAVVGSTTWADGKTYANPEGFVNYGPLGWKGPKQANPLGHDYLLVANGHDDNGNGWVDEGWDGVDNNNNGQVDEAAEWEQETWLGSLTAGIQGATYAIRRRPMPSGVARELAMPSNVVIDLSRSNLPASTMDLIVSPSGQWSPSLPYGVPSSIQLGGSWFQFWLAERADMGQLDAGTPPSWIQSTPAGSWRLLSLNGQTGRLLDLESPDPKTGLAMARRQ